MIPVDLTVPEGPLDGKPSRRYVHIVQVPEGNYQKGKHRFFCVHQAQNVDRHLGEGKVLYHKLREEQASPGECQNRTPPDHCQVVYLLLVHELFHAGTGLSQTEKIEKITVEVLQILEEGYLGAADVKGSL